MRYLLSWVEEASRKLLLPPTVVWFVPPYNWQLRKVKLSPSKVFLHWELGGCPEGGHGTRWMKITAVHYGPTVRRARPCAAVPCSMPAVSQQTCGSAG